MVETTVTTIKAVAVTTGSAYATYLAGFNEYVPYLVGGISLAGYMVVHNEIKLKSLSPLYVILGAILIGYLTGGLLPTITEFIYTFIPTETIDKMPSLQDGTAIESITNLIKFGAGALSRTVLLKFFRNRDKLVDSVIDRSK